MCPRRFRGLFGWRLESESQSKLHLAHIGGIADLPEQRRRQHALIHICGSSKRGARNYETDHIEGVAQFGAGLELHPLPNLESAKQG